MAIVEEDLFPLMDDKVKLASLIMKITAVQQLRGSFF